jgi:hypothetical protein
MCSKTWTKLFSTEPETNILTPEQNISLDFQIKPQRNLKKAVVTAHVKYNVYRVFELWSEVFQWSTFATKERICFQDLKMNKPCINFI